MNMSEALRIQGKACASLGSPFMGRLFDLLERHWPSELAVAECLDGWAGDAGPGGDSLPLRLAGGLHALVLSGRDDGLRAAYPPNDVPDSTLAAAFRSAMATHEAFLLDWLSSPPQTNEVRRSAALIPAAHWIAGRHNLPFVTSELGASAGLNLNWDQFALRADGARLGPEVSALTLTPTWEGPTPAAAHVAVAARAGVDLNPLDGQSAAGRLRIFAYLWPDQPERLALTRSALKIQNTPVEKGDAIDWLANRLDMPRSGNMHLIYHTIAWQYFPADLQERGTRLIEAAGARASAEAPLAWVSLENDGANPGASLTLRLWPGDLRLELARVDFHGRWVRWLAE